MSEREADQQLVERVQKGDKRAFDLLVLKYQHKVISLVGRYVNNHEDALDERKRLSSKPIELCPGLEAIALFILGFTGLQSIPRRIIW